MTDLATTAAGQFADIREAPRINVARRLTITAARMGEALAVVVPRGRARDGKRRYDTFTFTQLEEESNRLASGLGDWGVTPGARIALLVPPSMEFIALVFALFKAGAVIVLIDPGMGRAESHPLPGRRRAGRFYRDSAGAGDSRDAQAAVSAGPIQRDGRPAIVLGWVDAG